MGLVPDEYTHTRVTAFLIHRTIVNPAAGKLLNAGFSYQLFAWWRPLVKQITHQVTDFHELSGACTKIPTGHFF
jgi:hypothetical protein